MDENLKLAGDWLRQHGLNEADATPVLATRLDVRRRAKLFNSLLLAGLYIAAAAAQAVILTFSPDTPAFVALLAVVAGGLLAGQFMVDRWVRSVDRQVGATLSRRAAHPLHPGWRALFGPAHALLGLGAFAGAAALAVSALVVSDPTVRYTALVLVIGVFAVGAMVAVQVRHLVMRPVVADDAMSLTADVIMRIEDARDTNTPAVLWSLPVVLMFGFAPMWWGVASVVFLVAGTAALVLVQYKAPSSGVMARRVVRVR
ncbi:hypothetical protein GCM10009557_42020 [Virgisporangium ochraceum]|uniref:Uncharacterized protein n=1 Tax=Virgisporangium ochraceum TaxID=65505 RepID=A0A8J4EEH9_9ACTN|nr:hypothetical protein [Virgisporangium ochraceum]GIJ71784.1 hypothetical protein Voc01_067010 [Virgisporangium ochraceum]